MERGKIERGTGREWEGNDRGMDRARERVIERGGSDWREGAKKRGRGAREGGKRQWRYPEEDTGQYAVGSNRL